MRAISIAAIALVLSAGAAHAHSGSDRGQAVITAIAPAIEGVELVTIPGDVAKLRMTTQAGTRVTLLGNGGQPVLRIGPAGVDANRAAPEWYAFNEPLGIAQVPPGAKPGARPRWQRVSRLRSWEWFDHRLHPGPASVTSWTIPIEVDGVEAQVRGRFVADSPPIALRLDEDVPLPGASVETARAATLSLIVGSAARRPVEILGGDGELFARITPQGVEANVHSPIWLATGQFRNRDMLAGVIDPAAEARLVSVGPAAELVWPDPRLLPDRPVKGPPGTVVKRWSIPMRTGSGGTPTLVTGRTVIDAKIDQAGAPMLADATSEGDDGAPVVFIVLLALVSAAALAALVTLRPR